MNILVTPRKRLHFHEILLKVASNIVLSIS